MGHKEDMQVYEKTEKGKTNRAKIMRKYDKNHRLETRARQVIRNAVHRGKMIRSPVCEKCNKKKKTFAHHLNFNKPFDIIEICRECYKKYYC